MIRSKDFKPVDPKAQQALEEVLRELGHIRKEIHAQVVFRPTGWIRQQRYCEITGTSPSSLKKMRNTGKVLEGKHWKRGPEGRWSFYWNWDEMQLMAYREGKGA